jgi:hypothetical protein
LLVETSTRFSRSPNSHRCSDCCLSTRRALSCSPWTSAIPPQPPSPSPALPRAPPSNLIGGAVPCEGGNRRARREAHKGLRMSGSTPERKKLEQRSFSRRSFSRLSAVEETGRLSPPPLSFLPVTRSRLSDLTTTEWSSPALPIDVFPSRNPSPASSRPPPPVLPPPLLLPSRRMRAPSPTCSRR